MQKNCENQSLIWKNVYENSKNEEYVNNVKEQIFNMYKNRPIYTPINDIEELFKKK